MISLPLATMVGAAALGLLFAWRALETEQREHGLDGIDLRIEDLERRREELYDRLRGSESVDLAEQDRADLEIQAAHVLRELDQLQQRGSAGRRAVTRKRQDPAEEPATFTGRHPLLAGFLLGGGMVGLLGVLLAVAQRDAQPEAPQPTADRAAQNDPSGSPPAAAAQPELPPRVASEVASLRATLTGGLEDAAIHAQIADLLLAGGRPIDAFEEAQAALDLDDGSSQALYVQGVVRFMMGHAEPAIEMLDRALASDPRNAQAALMKGVFYLQLEDRESAMRTWRGALEELDGDARIERLLALAEEGLSAREILQAGPGD